MNCRVHPDYRGLGLPETGCVPFGACEHRYLTIKDAKPSRYADAVETLRDIASMHPDGRRDEAICFLGARRKAREFLRAMGYGYTDNTVEAMREARKRD